MTPHIAAYLVIAAGWTVSRGIKAMQENRGDIEAALNKVEAVQSEEPLSESGRKTLIISLIMMYAVGTGLFWQFTMPIDLANTLRKRA